MYPTATRKHALALIAQGRSLNWVSKRLGISRAAIRDWRDHGVAPKHRDNGCFVCLRQAPSDEPAYARLFGYYLGDGCISRLRSTFSLRISCDETYSTIITDVTEAVRAVHPDGAVCHVRAPGVIVVQNCWDHWPCLFPQHGPGRKHERKLRLEPWQAALVAEHPADFLRGLFHSDGCRVNNWATRMVAGQKKRYDYPRWQFTNHSADIRAWCQDALDLLDIPWRQSNWKTVSVSTRAGVARLDELVGLKS